MTKTLLFRVVGLRINLILFEHKIAVTETYRFWSHGNNASGDRTVEACQTLECGASSIMSVFAGRAADFGHDPIPTLMQLQKSARSTMNGLNAWASTRGVYHILQAEQRSYFRTQLAQRTLV